MRDLNKLLDNEWVVVIYKNTLGSYTALATRAMEMEAIVDDAHDREHLTDDFTPEKAFKRLSEKFFRTGMYDGEGQG